jgi:uncharacterized protein (DUF849 family)
MAADERKQNERILREHKRRLGRLQEIRARRGSDTSPDVLTEIEDIEASIADLEVILSAGGKPKEETTEARRQRFGDDDVEFLIAQNRSITNRQTTTEHSITELKTANEKAFAEINEKITTLNQIDHADQLRRLQIVDDIQKLFDAFSTFATKQDTRERARKFWQPLYLFLLILALVLSGLALWSVYQ